jgi:hypothetical protein
VLLRRHVCPDDHTRAHLVRVQHQLWWGQRQANDGYYTEYLGLYEHQGFDSNGAPYYEHESGSYYMYLDDTGSYWYAGSVLGAASGLWFGAHVTNSPMDVVTWKVWDGDERVEQPGVAVESATDDLVYPALCWMEETPAPTTTLAPTSFACNINFGGTNDGYRTEYLGLYEYQGFDDNDAPFYKHESGSYYIYLLRVDGERWVVGDALGDQSMTDVWWYGGHVTNSPTDAVTWRVYGEGGWTVQPEVIVESVTNDGAYPGLCWMEETPAPTTIPTPAPSSFACNINFGGTNDGYRTEYLGLYEYQGLDTNGAPYYRHDSGSYYMYLPDGGVVWYVGDMLGSQSYADVWWLGYAITNSPADVATWKVYGDNAWVVQPEVTVEGVISGDTYSPECWAYTPELQAFNASTWQEVADGLGPDLFDFSHSAGVFEVDLLGPIVVEATIKVGRSTVVVFKSSNGLGELNGNHARRVLEVVGYGASVRVDGVAVRDGWHEPSNDEDSGGCIHVGEMAGEGATLTLAGGTVVSGCKSTGFHGVRTPAFDSCLRVRCRRRQATKAYLVYNITPSTATFSARWRAFRRI